MSDYYCLISLANDRICSICGASFRNLPFLPGKGGGGIFLAKWKLLSPPADTFQNRFVCVYVHTHDVYSDFGGADDTAKAETLPKSDRVTVLIFHSEDCLSY